MMVFGCLGVLFYAFLYVVVYNVYFVFWFSCATIKYSTQFPEIKIRKFHMHSIISHRARVFLICHHWERLIVYSYVLKNASLFLSAKWSPLHVTYPLDWQIVLEHTRCLSFLFFNYVHAVWRRAWSKKIKIKMMQGDCTVSVRVHWV